ncbi:MAG TPA: hypothetical protein VHN80_16235, partial [Kineosporiaceae bacterium]|nr:hypothetical protein [Kineosporiaceae bacterium]
MSPSRDDEMETDETGTNETGTDDHEPDDHEPDDHEPDDELAPESDAVWDEITSDTFRLLGALRAERRRQRARQSAYAVYVALLIFLIYVAPYLASALRASPSATAGPNRVAAVLPGAAVTLVLLVLVAFVRDALWRGPALLDLATSAWLLPAPIRRGPLLRPRLRATLLAAGVLGLIIGAVAGALLRPHTGGSTGDLVAAGSATGAVSAVLAVAAAGLVESAAAGVHRVLRRVGAWLWLLPTASAGLALLSARDLGESTGAAARVAGAVLLWSGPWGWAVQPLTAAVPRAAVGGTGAAWPVGLFAAALVAAMGVDRAYRRIDAVPGRVLRARAASAGAVAASIGTLQPRRARLLIQTAQGWTPLVRLRLPTPRRRSLLLLWRDATALLRMPSRLVWGLLWLAAAAALITAGAATSG